MALHNKLGLLFGIAVATLLLTKLPFDIALLLSAVIYMKFVKT